MICGGVPKPNQLAGRHPVVPMDDLGVIEGIRLWRCPVCRRFILEWLT